MEIEVLIKAYYTLYRALKEQMIPASMGCTTAVVFFGSMTTVTLLRQYTSIPNSTSGDTFITLWHEALSMVRTTRLPMLFIR